MRTAAWFESDTQPATVRIECGAVCTSNRMKTVGKWFSEDLGVERQKLNINPPGDNIAYVGTILGDLIL